jgi:hypothetical protein
MAMVFEFGGKAPTLPLIQSRYRTLCDNATSETLRTSPKETTINAETAELTEQ